MSRRGERRHASPNLQSPPGADAGAFRLSCPWAWLCSACEAKVSSPRGVPSIQPSQKPSLQPPGTT